MRVLGYLLWLAALAGLVWWVPILWELALAGAIGGAYWAFFAPPASAGKDSPAGTEEGPARRD